MLSQVWAQRITLTIGSTKSDFLTILSTEILITAAEHKKKKNWLSSQKFNLISPPLLEMISCQISQITVRLKCMGGYFKEL